MKCPKCNADVKEGMKFCPSCGFEIPTVNICPQCGNEIPIGVSFCPKCGTSASNDQSKVEYKKSAIDSDVQLTNETSSTKMNYGDGFLPLSELLNAQASDIDAGMDADELFCLACEKNNVKDYLAARKLFEKAAYLKHRDSVNWLGVYYTHGYGVAANDLKAASFYKIAADLGDPYAQYNLACCYLDGKGIAKNEKLAFDLFNQAMNNGHVDAICSVGYCYETGKGCEPDKEKALYYYKLSAEKGNSAGKRNYHILLNENKNSNNFQNGADILKPLIAKVLVTMLVGYTVLSTIGLYIGTYLPSFAFWPLLTLLLGIWIHKKAQAAGITIILDRLNKPLLIGFVGIVLLGGIYHQFSGSSDTPTGNPIEDANTLEAIYHDGGDTDEFLNKVKSFYWEKYGAKGGGLLYDQKLNEFMDEAQKHLDNLNNR